ncbi:unnamed protein product [Amoebophrya sp. A25]|nr:unnamed protein product [Amoebophrya sp. A25]|eukprot:GSA25T00009059001.1
MSSSTQAPLPRGRHDLKSRNTTTTSSSRKMTIYVFDETTGGSRNFTCRQDVLLQHMKYFRSYLSESSASDDVEISVHCDVGVFAWLVRYMDNPAYISKLSASTVVSILISAQFLQMDALVEKCMDFLQTEGLDKVLALPIDLSCLTDGLLERLADRVGPESLEGIHDPEDKLISKLYDRHLTRLLANSEELHRCVFCRALFFPSCLQTSGNNSRSSTVAATKKRSNQVKKGADAKASRALSSTRVVRKSQTTQHDCYRCPKAELFIDFNGRVIAQHVTDRDFDIHEQLHLQKQRIAQIRRACNAAKNEQQSSNMTSGTDGATVDVVTSAIIPPGFTMSDLYWQLWGRVNMLHCSVCDQVFPLADYHRCLYHPEEPIFPDAAGKAGRYPCCDMAVLRFDSTEQRRGCCERKHQILKALVCEHDAEDLCRLLYKFEDKICRKTELFQKDVFELADEVQTADKKRRGSNNKLQDVAADEIVKQGGDYHENATSQSSESDDADSADDSTHVSGGDGEEEYDTDDSAPRITRSRLPPAGASDSDRPAPQYARTLGDRKEGEHFYDPRCSADKAYIFEAVPEYAHVGQHKGARSKRNRGNKRGSIAARPRAPSGGMAGLQLSPGVDAVSFFDLRFPGNTRRQRDQRLDMLREDDKRRTRVLLMRQRKKANRFAKENPEQESAEGNERTSNGSGMQLPAPLRDGHSSLLANNLLGKSLYGTPGGAGGVTNSLFAGGGGSSLVGGAPGATGTTSGGSSTKSMTKNSDRKRRMVMGMGEIKPKPARPSSAAGSNAGTNSNLTGGKRLLR